MRQIRRLLLTLLCGACAGAQPHPGGEPDAGPVAVQVSNQHRRDVAVYWVSSGVRMRLGTTVAGGQSRFVVRNTRAAALANVSLTAEVIGSGEQYGTGRIVVAPGQTIELRLQDLLSTSEFSVREEPRPRGQPRSGTQRETGTPSTSHPSAG